MTPDSPVIAELRPLLDALCEQTITPEQLKRLEELVLTHPEAEAFYVQYMSFAADVVRTAARLPHPAEPVARSSEPSAKNAEPPHHQATDTAPELQGIHWTAKHPQMAGHHRLTYRCP